MTRRGAMLAVVLAVAGQKVSAQEQLAAGQAWKIEPWKIEPPWLRVALGGKDGLAKIEVIGPDGRTLTFTPEQIMAALAEET